MRNKIRVKLIKIEKLNWEKDNLFSSLQDFQIAYQKATTNKFRKAVKTEIEIIKTRLSEFYRVLDILKIKIG